MINNMHGGINWAGVWPGTVLSSGRIGYRHFGIVTDKYVNGLPTVISNAGDHGKVVEQPLAEFHGKWDLKIEGYWGSLPYQEVLARGRGQVGSIYSLFTWNCEHFVRFAHGIKPESPQLAAIAAVGVLAVALIGLSRA